jgi:hypothetical protein
MTKFSIVMVSLVASAGVAAAGAGSGATGAAAGAGAKVDVKAGAKVDAKAGAGADAGAMMKAPTELADMAKGMAGTFKCKGQALGHDMKTMVDMTGTMKAGKLETDNWWIHDVFDATMGKEKFHFDAYTTYDAGSKKWHRVMVETGGGYSVGDSAGMQGGKLDWDLTSWEPMGQSMFRDHLDASDPKAGVKAWGEFSIDKGKTWTKVYEQTCKK